ncbi:MAG: hypothetical protein M1287_00665 [Firmicutes bacterium]|nr:hypothetical protein [Bacillota bacterium]
MSIHGPEENDHSSTPEESDQYCYGDFYYHLKGLLQHARPFRDKAYFPNRGGLKTVTNRNTANGCVRIIEGVSMREPDESDLIYFSKEFLESAGIDWRRLKSRLEEDHYIPEQTGVYPKIDPDVFKRIMNEPPLADPKNEKKTG